MYLLDSKRHHLPHIQAKYAEFEACIGIGDGEIVSGELSRKQLRRVQAWIELHRDELCEMTHENNRPLDLEGSFRKCNISVAMAASRSFSEAARRKL